MASLTLNFNYTSDLKKSIGRAVDKFESRRNDYDGIMKDNNSIPSKTGNLSNCNIYLKKKRTQLQGKIDKLNSFKSKVSTFSSNAEASDKRISTYVKDQSEYFYKTVGIKTGLASAWEGFKKGCKNFWEGVKEFYNKHKFVIDFIVDAALLVVAVVAVIAAIPTGGATLFFAGFALAGALGDMATSSTALGYHIVGDDETAGVWADRGLKDGIKWVGKQLDGGEEGFFSSVFGFAYDALSLASVVYSIGKLGKNLFKSIDLRNTNNLSVFERFTNAGKEIFGLKTTGTSGKNLASCWQIKELFGLKSVDAARKIMLGCDFIKNLKQTIKITNSVFDGTFLSDGNKIGDSINKFGKSIISTVDTVKNGYKYVTNPTPVLNSSW